MREFTCRCSLGVDICCAASMESNTHYDDDDDDDDGDGDGADADADDTSQ